MKRNQKFDKEKLLINPFSFTLQIPVTKVISNIDYERDLEDGVFHNKSFYVEKTKKTVLYHCDSCKENTLGLSDKALRLYMWVQLTLNPGQDFIEINKDTYMKKSGTKSINTYKDALKELIRYSYIAATEFPTVFWINPNIFFSGNRLNKYPNNIVEKNTWEK